MWRSKKGGRCGALRRMVHTTVRLSSVASLPSKPFPAPNSTTNEDFPSNPRLRSCPTSDSNCNLDVRRTWMNSTHKIHGVAHSGCATHVDVQSAQNAAAFAHITWGVGGGVTAKAYWWTARWTAWKVFCCCDMSASKARATSAQGRMSRSMGVSDGCRGTHVSAHSIERAGGAQTHGHCMHLLQQRLHACAHLSFRSLRTAGQCAPGATAIAAHALVFLATEPPRSENRRAVIRSG